MDQACWNTRLADPLYSETSLIVFRIWKFLSEIHLSLLRHCQTPKWLDKKGQEIWMDKRMPNIIWHPQTMFHWRTHTLDARSLKTIPDRIWCIKSCYRSCSHSSWPKWKSTPGGLPISDLYQHWTLIWNTQLRTLGNYLSTQRMETLHSRIWTHNRSSFQSQKLDVLQNHPEIEWPTSLMVTVSLRIWH